MALRAIGVGQAWEGILVLTLLLVGACGCSAMRSQYARPALSMPAEYAHADGTAGASLDEWWRSFRDPQLDELIEEALARNNDLALAVLNVRAAELQVHLAVINPTVAVGYTGSFAKPLKNSLPSTQVHSVTASAAYEIDLWDQLASVKDAARWEVTATRYDRQSAVLTLVGTAVGLYYELAELNTRIRLGDESLAYVHQVRDLVGVQTKAGAASQLEIAQADQTVQAQEAEQADLIEARTEVRNALAVLLNGHPWSEDSELQRIPETLPPAVAAGIPATLLDRRPDLEAAEARLRESLADTDATRLSFYPNLTLTPSVGTLSPSLSQLLNDPIATVTAALTLPFIQINAAHFGTALARTRYEMAAVSFRKTVLQALYDVDNALSARAQLATEGAHLEQSLAAARAAEHLDEVLYQRGAIALRAWLDTQEVRRQAEISLASNRLSRLQNYAVLCQALGGDAQRL